MSERDNILARIRQALTIPAPLANAREPVANQGTTLLSRADHRRVLPAVGNTFEANVALFEKNAAELKADFFLLNNESELIVRLAQLRDAEGWMQIASHKGPLTDPVCDALALPVCLTDDFFRASDLEKCHAGISQCDALVAQTGSVVVTSRSSGGRALSVLPPHHVVLARRGQLVGGLSDAFALLKGKYGGNYPSMISFITGPSRTGDIERILVLGAHGPKKLTIFCV